MVNRACLPNAYFAMERGLTWRAPPSTLSLFYNAIFTILTLIIINAPLKKLTPRYALTQQELLVIYIMISISTAIAGHDEIQIVASIVPHVFQLSTASVIQLTRASRGAWRVKIRLR